MGVCITCISWPFLGCSQVSSAPPYIIRLMQGWLMVLAMQHELTNRINCEWKVWKWVRVCRQTGLIYSLSKRLQSLQPSIYHTLLSVILHYCECLSLVQWIFPPCRCIHASVAPQDSLVLSQDDSSPGTLLHVTLSQHRERLGLKYSLLHLYRNSPTFFLWADAEVTAGYRQKDKHGGFRGCIPQLEQNGSLKVAAEP